MRLNISFFLTLLVLNGLLGGSIVTPGEGQIIPCARPNPYDRGNCFQWKGCKGESIGSMPVDSPEFCGPLGGKSWKAFDGRCLDLKDGPRSSEPSDNPNRPTK
ncbi:MAG: hypothetical protein LBS60_11775 [Deltaproteobacteria bacterium]|nr:hypothetical protein [Deltaproteobacteria bacterium]